MEGKGEGRAESKLLFYYFLLNIFRANFGFLDQNSIRILINWIMRPYFSSDILRPRNYYTYLGKKCILLGILGHFFSYFSNLVKTLEKKLW